MAAARVVHYGVDFAFRTQVLRSAGFEVEDCATLSELDQALRNGKTADLICISEAQDEPAEGAIALAGHFASAPLVLFRAAEHVYVQRGWDLEIEALTRPSDWLGEVAELIARSRANRAKSAALHEQSRKLCAEAAQVNEQTLELRDRIQRQRDEWNRRPGK